MASFGPEPVIKQVVLTHYYLPNGEVNYQITIPGCHPDGEPKHFFMTDPIHFFNMIKSITPGWDGLELVDPRHKNN